MISVSIGIPTRNRIESLSLCLLSIAMQSYKALEVIIVDDSDNPVNLTTIPIYKYIFQLLEDKGIKWKCIWGQRRGQHISHQIIQDIAEGDYIFRCFTCDQKVETDKGLVRFDKLQVGDVVKTHKNRYRKILNVFKTPYRQKQPLILINTLNSKIKCTPNHPFLVRLTNTKDEWVEAKDLYLGHKLLYPATESESVDSIELNCISGGRLGIPIREFSTIEVDVDMARFLGLYLAEGCGGHDSIRFTFNNNEKDNIDFISRMCIERFGRKPTIHIRWATQVKLNIRNFSAKFVEWFGKEATIKKVPDFVFSFSLKNKLSFIKGYLDGDGWVHGNMASFVSASYELAHGMKRLLNECGIDCIEPTFREKTISVYKGVQIKSNGSFECRISVEGYNKILDLLHYPIKNGFIEMPILDIQRKKMYNSSNPNDQFVYNLEVEEDNSYIANTYVVHNCDDDVVCEPNVLEELVKCVEHGMPMAMDENSDVFYQKPVGAVAPLVLLPNPTELPEGLTNDIRFMNYPNVQWFTQKNPMVMSADHLHCSFLYKKGVAKYEMGLTSASFREESLLTHNIKREGYELLITGHARVWHFMNTEVRNKNVELYQKDDAFFHAQLKMWGVNTNEEKVIVADMGIGDTWALKSVLREYSDTKQLILAVCYPDVFFDFDKPIKLISIAEAQLLLKDITPFNLYKWMIDNSWQYQVSLALKQMYEL